MPDRRDFLALSGGCLAHLLLQARGASAATRAAWTAPRRPVVRDEPFARLEQVGTGAWAVISTPLGGDRTTFANGGLIAGRNGVIAVEGFYTPAGASWLAARVPAPHGALAHARGGHALPRGPCVGRAGLCARGGRRSPHRACWPPTARADWPPAAAPWLRRPTRRSRAPSPTWCSWASRRRTPSTWATARSRCAPRAGTRPATSCCTTPTPPCSSPATWCGTACFPTTWTPIRRSCARRCASSRPRAPGPWCRDTAPIVTPDALARYEALLDDLEQAARRGHAAGTPAADVAAAYTVPETLGEWMASRGAITRAMTAWYRVLAPGA